MRVVVASSTDRWGEDPRVDGVFGTMEKAQAFAEAETARTHGVARRDDWVLSARMFPLDEFEIDDDGGSLNIVMVGAPAIADARVSFGLHPRPPLTLASLRGELERFKIRSDVYDLDGAGREACYCIESTPEGWVTFYRDRGIRTLEKRFDSEIDACTSFLTWVFRDKTTHP